MNISFIIPIYNVEKYLDQCVQSILIQTYKDFEILLVDDGSPDNCPQKCDKWSRIDSRVKALHKPNGGLSDARNYGLQHAKGDYVVFIDGDDFWQHSDDLEKLVSIAMTNPMVDFIGYNCNYYYTDTNIYTPWVKYAEDLSSLTDNNSAIIALVKSGTFPMSACLKLLKREFLIKNEIYFIKGLICEDIPWFLDILDKSKNCIFVNNYIYAYRQNVVGSITSSLNGKTFSSLFNILKSELKKLNSRSFSDSTKDAIKSFLAYEFCILLVCEGINKKDHEELISYNFLLNYTLNPKVKKASMVYKIFGIKATEFVLKIYNKKRIAKSNLG